MATPKQIQELAADLLTRTKFTKRADGKLFVPGPSTFTVAPADLKVIQPYGSWDFEGKQAIKVRHHACKGEVEFHLDARDPIFSVYRCLGVDNQSSFAYDYCEKEWELRDLLKMTQAQLEADFYTELCEEDGDLGEWPVKLTMVQERYTAYSTLRPITQEELVQSRARRILEIRGVK